MPGQERIDFRVDADTKAEFVEAAQAYGMNLSSFMIAAAREFVLRIQRQQQGLQLSDRDRDRFLAALDRPPRPAPDAFRQARKRHRRLAGDD